ncbi:hypothetical protein PHYPSEUDO_000601 [Phytophthora pseudosyringae]|uniref:FYVE-type domain-containing protein n=1 Tax=Phytophthora pseudosyringae TaxID=221518 RepID=A0A8T1W281_9STRA|nr:hypothetical protein PHYPSEUDO_000601 [Phytophthora pseudosyringae]
MEEYPGETRVRLHRGRHLNCAGQTPLLCVGTLRGRFDDVLEGLYCDSTEDMLLMNAIKCPRLAESAILYAVQKQTLMEPYAFTGIKWATITLSVASNRDLCYFEKMGMVRQRSGKRMAYHVMQSVDLPEYPHKSLHKRVRLSLCYILEELENGLVGVYMQGDMNDTALSCFASAAVSDVLLAVANTLECTRAKKLAHLMLASRPGVRRRNPSRKNCYVCKASASLFEGLINCAGCDRQVCKKCRLKEHVLARDTTSNSELKRTEFCSVCISKTNLSSLDQIRVEISGYSVAELGTIQNDTFCKIEEETEDATFDIQGSDRSLTSFVRKISAQMQELSRRGDNRAFSLSSMGKASEDDLQEGNDVLNSSRLKSDQFTVPDKMACRSRSSTTSTSSSSYGHDGEDPKQFKASLFAKLEQVANQAEETLVFAREQSLVARSVRERSRRRTQSSEDSVYTNNHS